MNDLKFQVFCLVLRHFGCSESMNEVIGLFVSPRGGFRVIDGYFGKRLSHAHHHRVQFSSILLPPFLVQSSVFAQVFWLLLLRNLPSNVCHFNVCCILPFVFGRSALFGLGRSAPLTSVFIIPSSTVRSSDVYPYHRVM